MMDDKTMRYPLKRYVGVGYNYGDADGGEADFRCSSDDSAEAIKDIKSTNWDVTYVIDILTGDVIDCALLLQATRDVRFSGTRPLPDPLDMPLGIIIHSLSVRPDAYQLSPKTDSATLQVDFSYPSNLTLTKALTAVWAYFSDDALEPHCSKDVRASFLTGEMPEGCIEVLS